MIPDINEISYIIHKISYILYMVYAIIDIFIDISRGSWFYTWSGNILSFLLPLFQKGQLSVTGESMCRKYWLTTQEI